MLIVPLLLLVMLVVLAVHGFVLRRRTSEYTHGVFFDVGGSHQLTFTESMQSFAPTSRSHGFDTKHWNSIYWG